jgi:hypothetical protein
MQEIQDTTPVDVPKPGTPSGERMDTRRIIGIVLIAVVVLAAIVALIFGMVTHPILTAVLRDIAIIALALVTLVIGLFLVVLIFQMQSLIALLRDEIKPILESANETANTVRGTTTFMSDAVVAPMINVVSLAAGVGQTLKTLAGTGKRNRRRGSQPGPQQDQ